MTRFVVALVLVAAVLLGAIACGTRPGTAEPDVQSTPTFVRNYDNITPEEAESENKLREPGAGATP